MLPRPVAAGLVASLLVLTGCSIPASEAAQAVPTTSTTTPETTSTTAAPTTTTTVPVPALTQALRALWSRTPASSCLMVADGPKVLFERNPDAPVLPASTNKLLTATAVLARIDPSSRLSTPVVATARPDATGTVNGDLWMVGGGDPVLGTMPYKASFKRQPRLVNAVENLADRLVAAGVKRVTGRVVGDDGRYERLRYLPTWPARYVEADETGPLSALSVNDGFVAWSPTAVPMADPARGAARVLTDLLRQRGVVVAGEPTSGTAPAGAVELAALPSPTIAELVRSMLLDSDNGTAELLLRELGLRVTGRGTTEAGRRVVVETLTGMGLPMKGVRYVDGSGLDRGNRVTCRFLVALLPKAPAKDLPVAAQSGTLYKRFLGTPVAGHLRAKTGSIRFVAALAGFADGANRRTLTFAFVQNDVGARQGSLLQDELGHGLVLRSP